MPPLPHLVAIGFGALLLAAGPRPAVAQDTATPLAGSSVEADDDDPGANPDVDPETLTLFERADVVLATVAKLRGLEPRAQVAKGLLTTEELRALLLVKLAEDKSDVDLENEAKVLKKLGLLPRDMDYKQFILDLLSEQIAGFYDDETKELIVMRGQDPELVDAIFSHEIFHAIQDQHFNIARLRAGGDDNADLMTARVALIEGDAMGVMIDFELYPSMTFTDLPGFQTLIRSSVAMTEGIAGQVLESAPLIIKESLTFPYVDGLFFVAIFKAEGGWEAVDRVYDDPPDSTEQILHPERYLDRDDPTWVTFDVPAALTTGQSAIYDNVTGEVGLLLYFKQHALELGGDRTLAPAAAAGWDGDRTRAWEDAAGNVLYLQLSVWDGDEDAAEFADAMAQSWHLRFPEARPRPLSAADGGGARLVSNGESLLVERRGNEVLVVEGYPDDDPLSLQVLRDTVFASRRLGPYPDPPPAASASAP